MLMIFSVASIIRGIYCLKAGNHPLDPAGLTRKMISDSNTDICFRAGLETGSAMIGPLGSQRRKIVTAVGEAVNIASRLESSGIKEQMHISQHVFELLDQAVITPDMKILWFRIVTGLESVDAHPPDGIPFFEAFAQYFKLNGSVYTERRQISYKEFSPDLTYSLRCINPLDTEETSPFQH